ncbi:NAD(P)/FAD-dependent oxidoreductase [Plantactinospora solaniradicis]|uniref:NAD(P)/FAD-dependent oxidoreductase n=1 Tax=Plantactinospora solaniradicis TaxID=1723736 RepID=A0ABW1KMM7_9ACTN
MTQPSELTFVIVGASLAGAKAAETLRAEGFVGRIVLVGEEIDRPYERPPLSKGYLLGTEPREKAFVHDADWYGQHRIELLLGRRATDLDPSNRTLTLDGSEPLRYDKLLLATGSRVRTLDVPGADLPGVRYLRRIEQSDELGAALRSRGSVVVVGAGWIGLEVAAAAHTHGCPVTVVEKDELPLRRVLGDEVAAIYRDLHLAHGVDFRFGTGVREFRGRDGRLTGVVLDDGTELPADLVLVGVGIDPATELAEAAKLEVDDGIVTDAALRTADPDIYACGDVAAAYNPLLATRLRVEHWSNARNGGPAAARSMLGQPVEYDRVPYFFTDQYTDTPSLGMEYRGHVGPDGYDRVVFRGDPTVRSTADPEFIAFWLRADRVLAAMNVNRWDDGEPLEALVRAGHQGRSVDPDRLTDPGVPLTDLLR